MLIAETLSCRTELMEEKLALKTYRSKYCQTDETKANYAEFLRLI